MVDLGRDRADVGARTEVLGEWIAVPHIAASRVFNTIHTPNHRTWPAMKAGLVETRVTAADTRSTVPDTISA